MRPKKWFHHIPPGLAKITCENVGQLMGFPIWVHWNAARRNGKRKWKVKVRILENRNLSELQQTCVQQVDESCTSCTLSCSFLCFLQEEAKRWWTLVMRARALRRWSLLCWLRMAMKMMSWRRIQHRRNEDADENEDDQQDEDVRLMKLMKMWGWWESGGWIYNAPSRVP